MPAYQSFFGKVTADPGSVEVRVNLALTNMPDAGNLTRIFETGPWSMYKGDDEYFLTLNSGIPAQPQELARFGDDITQVTVYYSQQAINDKNGQSVVFNPVSYPLGQLLLMYILAPREGALLHAAGIDLHGRGFIFPGKSGAGKSTLARQFAARQELEVLSDDRIVVRKIDGAFQAFGTPWPGEEEIALNKSVPLAGIFFICHGPANKIQEIEPQAALERLLPVTSIPWYDREVLPKILQFCEDLITHIPTFELQFEPGVEVVEFVEEFVSTYQ